MATRFCPNCATPASPQAKFCRGCGGALDPPEDAQAAPPAATTAIEQGSLPSSLPVGAAVAVPPVPPSAVAAAAAPTIAAAPVEQGLLGRAKQNDRNAIETMFRQFLPTGERVVACEYFGVLGFWGFGRDSFGIATDRRVAGLQVGSFGEVLYQDAPLEYVNSTIIYQPSRSGLYVTVGAFAIVTFGFGLLLAPLIARGYYRRTKSGLVLNVREGVSVYVFIDRKRLPAANRFYKEFAGLREDRIRRVGWT